MLRRVAPVADMYARLSTLALCFYHHYSCFPQKTIEVTVRIRTMAGVRRPLIGHDGRCQATINWNTIYCLGLARPVLARKFLSMEPPRAHLK